MDRTLIAAHLAQAERHVTAGEHLLQNQRDLLERIRQSGYDTATAEDILRQFERVQASHIEDRDRLRRELRILDAPAPGS
ncbi:MAG TPA: hypothetical protein VFS52_18810 [Steroidobacteraceae bacterium]|jgi:hypothetical protein|nr:hypothetical protein [Steroidobacteraceae bacterium]